MHRTQHSSVSLHLLAAVYLASEPLRQRAGCWLIYRAPSACCKSEVQGAGYDQQACAVGDTASDPFWANIGISERTLLTALAVRRARAGSRGAFAPRAAGADGLAGACLGGWPVTG